MGQADIDPDGRLAGPLRRWLRRLGLGFHLLAGLVIVFAVYPLVAPARRQWLKQAWSRQMLRILGIRLEVRGAIEAGVLLVANHISWVDIFVINAACPTTFVAKAEVRNWPLIGALAARTETLFIERQRGRHALHIAHRMAELLAGGGNVAFFPEGTTTDGAQLLPFHAALLQPAISAGVAVQPLAIAYRDADGKRATAPAYVGDTSFMECVAAIMAAKGLQAELDCLPPVVAIDRNRREIAADCAAQIQASLDCSMALATARRGAA